MARERRVTRTIDETIATVMVVNIKDATVTNEHVCINGKFESKDKLLTALNGKYDNDTRKVVTVIDFYTEEVLYGMSEEDFIMCAYRMDKR